MQEQGIVSQAETLTCTCVPTDLYAAWQTVHGFQVSQGEFALEGVTRIEGATTGEYLHHIPPTLEHLSFDRDFNQSLEGVTLPSSLQSLRFRECFDQSLKGVTLPSSLQSLSFDPDFNQSLEEVTLPSSLQSLTFGECFDQSLKEVTLPSSLELDIWP